MAQDGRGNDGKAAKRAQLLEAERREKLTLLVLCREKLSDDEVLLLQEVFPELLALHQEQVWNWLRKRGLLYHEAEDLLQETFLALYNHIRDHGFPDNLSGMLRVLTEGQLMNHVRTKRRAPVSLGLPSSGSEKPRSDPDVARIMTRKDLVRRLVDQLSPEHQSVIDTVILNDLSHRDAADVLALPVGTVKSRVMAAKRELLELMEGLLPPSQRDAT